MNTVKIIYIEDDEADVFIFRQHIKRVSDYNIKLISILNIENEMDKIFKMDFDLIFLDYLLINTTGMEVLSMLRLFGIKVPIILLTDVLLDSKTNNKLRSLGLTDYILKSKFNAETLEKIIGNVFNLGKYKSFDENYEIINLRQILFFHNDGRLIYSSTINNGEIKLWNEDRQSPTLLSASLYIINTFMHETTGFESPFQEMKSSDMFITYERGETIGMCIISENSCKNIRNIFGDIVVSIENQYSEVLKNWNGNLQLLNFQPHIIKLQSFVGDKHQST